MLETITLLYLLFLVNANVFWFVIVHIKDQKEDLLHKWKEISKDESHNFQKKKRLK